MLTRITGKLSSVGPEALTLVVGPMHIEVLIPDFARRQLQQRVGQDVTLHTIAYLEGNPMQGRLTPRLIGFLSPVEREFFDLFCSVDGVGAKKALRAMVRPVHEVATAIEEQDAKQLSGLPGVGPATAERVIAKLRRKMPRFALLVAREAPAIGETGHDVVADSFEALRTLGHSESDARRLIDQALEAKKKYADVESVLAEIYRQRQGS